MTTDEKTTAVADPPSRGPLRDVLAFARNTWRGLTSMRTALVLLFLLALAALPGALLPQYSLNVDLVDRYYAENPRLAPLLDRLGLFGVFSSVWFAAIYLLLFVSLVGCLLPRSIEHVKGLRARPVATPRNLGRLPHSARSTSDAAPADVIAGARAALRGWRVAEDVEPSGARTLSAEKGHPREVGNLVFHFALLGLLVTFAIGKLYGYEGQVIVLANGSQFCNSGLLNYDSFKPGTRVDGTDLEPFCVRVDSFAATYDAPGQADSFSAEVAHQTGGALDTGEWTPQTLRVNHPLRLGGERVYLLGHGYAPRFTVRFPNGEERTQVIQWRTADPATLLSEGATKFDPPGVTSDAERRTRQLAITGLFAPTAFVHNGVLTSSFPELRDPAVAVDVLRGDLGTDSGRSQSIFEIDQRLIDDGRLERVARENLFPGDEITLDDGAVIRFDGVEQWIAIQVSHDPAQQWVLVFAVLVLGGLAASLSIKRRRVWVRATPAGVDGDSGRTVVEVGGLARTDQAGYGEEFTRLAARIAPPDDDGSESPASAAATTPPARGGEDTG